MAGPINPVTLAMIGAAGGAALKPNNPLQGALLGATAGFTGGTALGIGGATTAVGGGTGLTMGAGGTGLTAAGAGLSPTGGVLGTTGLTGAGTVGLTAPAATSGYALAAPVASSAAMAPTLAERLGMAGTSAYENPLMTSQALGATQGLLTPEQMPSPAPAMPLQAGRGVKPYDPMASLDPYKQSVVGGQPISLI
jgi:hypothetical protein